MSDTGDTTDTVEGVEDMTVGIVTKEKEPDNTSDK